MAEDSSHDKLIESVCDYKKGWTNIDTASAELAELAGFTPDIAKVFLKNMKRNNVTQIRGYSKEKDYQIEGKKGKPNEAKK